MRLDIITIGDELLYGQTIDTNSAWMAVQLNAQGWEVHEKITVGDKREHIKHAVKRSLENVDVVLLTGGLGPTNDDLTMQVLADFFESEIVFNEDVYSDISGMLSARGIGMNENNRKQAYVPKKCTPIRNKLGTAPGLCFEVNGKVLVSMPGVPHEMRGMMQHFVLPRLRNLFGGEVIIHRFIHTLGIPEAHLAEKISEWEQHLLKVLSLAYLPSPGMVKLRLTARGTDETLLHKYANAEIEKLQDIIGAYIIGYDEDTLASAIGKLLLKNRSTVSLAESCTGGYISHLITEVPGCSAYYKGAVISYANEIKHSLLGVSEKTLLEYGAVSKKVVEEMANGAKERMGSDYAIATSGIAGPEGGSEDKPVGTVWIAVCGKQGIVSEKFNFGNNRERNIIRAANRALMMLREEILNALD